MDQLVQSAFSFYLENDRLIRIILVFHVDVEHVNYRWFGRYLIDSSMNTMLLMKVNYLVKYFDFSFQIQLKPNASMFFPSNPQHRLTLDYVLLLLLMKKQMMKDLDYSMIE